MKASPTLSRLLLAASALGAPASAASTGSANKTVIADTVFHNGSIYSLDLMSSKHSALAVKDGYITFVGDEKAVKSHIGKNTSVFDLEGRMMMPGLVDAHMHVMRGGGALLKCNMNFQPLGLDKVLAQIQKCLDEEKDKSEKDWLEVINLDFYALSDATGGVTKKDLDNLKTKRPILVNSADMHTFWVNSAALKDSSITSKTEDPRNGKIERLAGGKEPSGILQDSASELLSGPAPPTDDENIQSVKAALKLLRQEGVTSFQDAAADETAAKAFAAVKKEGGLSARGFFDYSIIPPENSTGVDDLVEDVVKVTSRWNDKEEIGPVASLKWHAVKMFMDGVILYPSNTGSLIEPYFQPVDNSSMWEPKSNTGPKPYWDKDLLTRTLSGLFKKGIDAQIHVDGDMAVRTALDSLEAVREQNPKLRDYRVGFAHNEVTDPSDWPRFAELKADPIMSFQWSQASSVWLPNGVKSMGPRRAHYLEAFGEIAKFGSAIVYGSDWPIDPLDEWLAIKAGVTRSGDPENPNSPASQGAPYEGKGLPGLTLTREQAIRAITTESSRFLRADAYIGSLEVGKLADAIVLKANYFEVPEDEIARQKALLTMVGGEVVYIADEIDFGNGVEAKFPNNDTVSKTLDRRSVGGLQGRDLTQEGKRAVQVLQPRGVCGHSHKH
ncbi:putative amidohydrolase ytcj [Fusarium flagelliforme]|uniref:Putative amidohydrolase ytcj n=1 Tax=Fusarium flagelliforme TaxID=2675880 RepID=A0A395MSM5_9HYPO|nr:putative amidohydrolase ytcj [Fusarium flagelliforme]